MNTPLIVAVRTRLLIGLGLVVVVLDALPWGTETYTISTRDLPNTAPDLPARPTCAGHLLHGGAAVTAGQRRYAEMIAIRLAVEILAGQSRCQPCGDATPARRRAPRAPPPPTTGSSPSPAWSRCSPCNPGPATGPPPP